MHGFSVPIVRWRSHLWTSEKCVNKRARALFPVVKERQALVGQLQSILKDLGLSRRAKQLPDLTAYIAQQSGT